MNDLFFQKDFKIIHVDMDCFYAQVEMRDNPSLRKKPIAIGGPSKTKGVLCTSNYMAREYGVRAAQPTFKAFELCPNLVLIPPNFPKYEQAAAVIRDIFYRYTDKVQPLSLDEAYLDVTNCTKFHGSATLIAKAIKEDIYRETGLTASAGVSFNKMLAKIASDWNKPNGLFVITPQMRLDFMAKLPLAKIPGVGKVSAAKFSRMGLHTCADVLERDLFDLINIFGKRSALDLYEACQGISNSTVKDREQRKSFGIERTFFEPLTFTTDILDAFATICHKYDERLKRMDTFHLKNREVSTVFIKLRFSDFQTITREFQVDKDYSNQIIHHRVMPKKIIHELQDIIISNTKSSDKSVRLMGLGIKFRDEKARQLSFSWSA